MSLNPVSGFRSRVIAYLQVLLNRRIETQRRGPRQLESCLRM